MADHYNTVMHGGVIKPDHLNVSAGALRANEDRDRATPSDGAGELATERDRKGRFASGNPFRWASGQSGNPGGRPKGASFAAALARHAVTPVSCAPTGLWELWR